MRRKQKVVWLFAILGVAFNFTACTPSPSPSDPHNVVINAYVPPLEERVIRDAMNQSGVFSLALDPAVQMAATTQDGSVLQKALVDSMLAALGSENYICIEPVYDWAEVKLRMKVVDYNYKEWYDRDNGMYNIQNFLQVSFVLSQSGIDKLTKTYDWEEPRSARNKQQLPSQKVLLSKLAKNVVASFIEDIAPKRTYQMRKLEDFPNELSYVQIFIENKNYQSAVEEMASYMGEKDAEYYYNLAILYEAVASESEKANDMQKAKTCYTRCMQNGGSGNEEMVEAKARFDESFRQFSRLENQRRANKKCELDASMMFE